MVNELFETILKLKDKYESYQYGIKLSEEWNPEHKDYTEFNENIILTKEAYNKKLEYMKLQGKIELFDEILSSNPELCCISGCNQQKRKEKKRNEDKYDGENKINFQR